MDKYLVLVTGATGYMASRLIPRLLAMGYRVRCLARDPLRLHARAWFPYVDVVAGDVMVPSSLPAALEGVHTAYYLIHSMAAGIGYTVRERSGAHNFADAAGQAGLAHIIYLGGLANPNGHIPEHLRSRIETGEILRAGHVPVTEFRAGPIVGPGSISFEMIRFMTELMPIMIGPTWLRHKSQPIAVQNVIDYLLDALKNHGGHGKIFEIGGPDVTTYADLMLRYAHIRGLQRKLLMLPSIPLWFMALGVGLTTPVPTAIANPLIDGLRGDSLVRDDSARQIFPDVKPIGYDQAVQEALSKLHPSNLEPVWADGGHRFTTMKHEGFFIDHRRQLVNAPPEKIFAILASPGRRSNCLSVNCLWKLRGWLDHLVGGPDMRGCPDILRIGDALDFYRVEAINEGSLLRLYAECKAPGQGWVEWRIKAIDKRIFLTQTSFFAPRGLPGFLYWYLFLPFHRVVFRGLIRALADWSER